MKKRKENLPKLLNLFNTYLKDREGSFLLLCRVRGTLNIPRFREKGKVMFRKTTTFAVFSIIVLLLVSMYGVFPVGAPARSDLLFIPYESPDAAYAALEVDEVDILCMDLSPAQKSGVEADPNLQICSYAANDVFQYALNNNYSILYHPNAQSPTNKLEVRQAIAYLVNKTYIIENILQGQAVRIDQPIPAPQSSWCNESVVGPNYPYSYDPEKAAQLLATLGFNDTDGNGWLNYPDDWPGIYGADTTAYPLEVIYPSKSLGNLVGCYLISQLENTLPSVNWPEGYVGGGFKCHATTDPMIYHFMLLDRTYHIYLHGFMSGRFPTHLYFFYHSNFWYDYGPNYVTNYEHPLLDQYLEELYFASSIEQAMAACKKACGYMADYCVTIPLWSSLAYQAWREEVAGVVCMYGKGINNKYTYINAYRTDNPGAPLRIAIPEPLALNVIYSSWPEDWEVLNAIYPHLLNVNPYDLAVDQPWVAQDWEPGEWEDNGVTKTKVTYWLRKDVGIVAPETGDHIRNYTAHDVEFTIWYTYAFQDAWNWDMVMDADHTCIVSDYQIEVYLTNQSIWFYESIGSLPLLPKNETIDKLCYIVCEEFPADGEHKLSNPVVQVVNATIDGVPLVECVDYVIVAREYCHNVFAPKVIPSPDMTVKIYYYTPRWPPTGYYLGSDYGLTWQDTMYSLGPHYPSTSPFDLKKNPYFFLDPILGETDWRWYWVGTEKPRSGYYKIDILDVVKATGAYCTRGDGTFDPRFFPGADLDASDLCHIGILDLVVITGKYGMKWGEPPP